MIGEVNCYLDLIVTMPNSTKRKVFKGYLGINACLMFESENFIDKGNSHTTIELLKLPTSV